MRTLDKITISVTGLDWQRLLSPWSWLLRATSVEPIFMSCFGDWFLVDDKGWVLFLDLVSGELRKIAPSRATFDRMLKEPDARAEFLMEDLVIQLRDRGMLLKPGECYGFKLPIFVGGKIAPDNIEPTDHMLHQSIIGQLAEQTKNLPPGTKISKFVVDGETP